MRLLFIAIFLFSGVSTFSQERRVDMPTRSGFLYFGFGTNSSWYSGSDIRLKTGNSDFTLYDVRAKDDGIFKFTSKGGAPQYTYQVGYYWTKKNFGIEFNFDHIKYFVIPNQRVRVGGTINGLHANGDTALTPDFFKFEHSDGANYALFSFVKMRNLYSSQTGKSSLDLLGKAGLGPVYPKTNSTILGNHYDDRYHVSGYVVAVELGLRYTFLKNFYLASSFKGAYANYTGFLIHDGSGSQRWFGGHFVLVAGGQINIGK